MPGNCPDPNVLVAYLLGKLDPLEVPPIAEHVANCPTCDHSAESLEVASDTLVEQLRGALPQCDVSRDPEYQQVLARVQKLHPKRSAADTQVDLPLAPEVAQFGEYRLLAKLGQGGMGVVWKAEHLRMHRLVAIKTLHPARMKSPDMLRRFYQEVEVAAKLLHPNIVTAFDATEHQGRHYLVMEYVDGQDLARLMKHHGPLPPQQAAGYILQAARGLQFAHSKGIIHRDIKPSNLLLDRDGTVKILDMGLARVDSTSLPGEPEGDRLTQSDQVLGTCDYMAPEQAMDSRMADARGDIYSLGCTLFHLLAGRPPYEGDTPLNVVLAHCQAPIPSVSAIRGDVPLELDAICARMLAKQPTDRYPTMAEVVAALEGFIERERIEEAGRGASTRPRDAKEPERDGVRNRRRLAMLATAAGAVAVIALAVIVTIRHRDGTTTTIRPAPGSQVTVSGAGGAERPASSRQETNRGREQPAVGPSFLGSNGNWRLPPGAPQPAIAPFDAKQARKHQEAWAKYLGVPMEWTNSIGMKFVLIPPGEFDMGSTPEEQAWATECTKKHGGLATHFANILTEGPRHRVKISRAFYLSVCPVTQREYAQVMGVNPSTFAREVMDASRFSPSLSEQEREERRTNAARMAGRDTSRHPVEMVSWEEVTEFCRRLSGLPEEHSALSIYRLPTEAQWEYACRAGTTTRWYSGDDESRLSDVAWFNANADMTTRPVGQKLANAWGLYDMHGNLRQWCADGAARDYWQGSPAVDPLGPVTGGSHVLRGGSYCTPPFGQRSAARAIGKLDWRERRLGFRAVCEIRLKAESGTSQTGSRPTAASPFISPDGNWKLPPGAPPAAVAPFDAPKARAHQEAWAKYLGVPVEISNSIGMKLVLIPPGEFDMGSTPEEQAWAREEGKKDSGRPLWYFDRLANEGPRHRVRITKPFLLGMYHTTQAEYQRVMGVNPSAFCPEPINASALNPPLADQGKADREQCGNKAAGVDTSRRPVETVSWEDAMEFCRRLSAMPAERAARRVYRLPTEAEWEYACRAGTTTRWSCGDEEARVLEHGWFSKNSDFTTHPVGQKKPSVWGLCDMHGNVWQWCADWFGQDYYRESPANDPAGAAAGSARVLRGGDHHFLPSLSRSAYRYSLQPAFRGHLFGFRVVCEIASKQQPTPPAPTTDSPNAPPPAIAPFDEKKAKSHQAAWAKHLGVPVETTNSIGMKLVLIAPGEFLMGATPEEIAWSQDAMKIASGRGVARMLGEGPRHRVQITRPFFFGSCEVTQAEYERMVGSNPSDFTKHGEASARSPVDTVSWDDARTFCEKLSMSDGERAAGRAYRLPTEAEWEYACRAGTTTRWYFGDDEAQIAEHAWCAVLDGKQQESHPVSAKRPNPWGIYDLYGNVAEWCLDRFEVDFYQHSPIIDPIPPAEPLVGNRTTRGGNIYAWSVNCRSAARWPIAPATRHNGKGFRVLCEFVVPPRAIDHRPAGPPPPSGKPNHTSQPFETPKRALSK
jgi:formylglycine-generating enzyme required for sulfatase activity/serine/threonine protein kinase